MHGLLCRHVFICLGYIPRRGIAGSYCNSMFNHLKNCQTIFPSGFFIFILISSLGCPYFSTSLPTLVIIRLFDFNHPTSCEVVPYSFDLAFLWWLMMLSIFSCVTDHLCFLLEECLFRLFACFSFGIKAYFLSLLMRYLFNNICKTLGKSVGAIILFFKTNWT